MSDDGVKPSSLLWAPGMLSEGSRKAPVSSPASSSSSHRTQSRSRWRSPRDTLSGSPSYAPYATSSSSDSGTRAFAPVLTAACVPCREKHLGCDEERPCKRCITNDNPLGCTDAPQRKRGRPKGRLGHTRVSTSDPIPYPDSASVPASSSSSSYLTSLASASSADLSTTSLGQTLSDGSNCTQSPLIRMVPIPQRAFHQPRPTTTLILSPNGRCIRILGNPPSGISLDTQLVEKLSFDAIIHPEERSYFDRTCRAILGVSQSGKRRSGNLASRSERGTGLQAMDVRLQTLAGGFGEYRLKVYSSVGAGEEGYLFDCLSVEITPRVWPQSTIPQSDWGRPSLGPSTAGSLTPVRFRVPPPFDRNSISSSSPPRTENNFAQSRADVPYLVSRPLASAFVPTSPAAAEASAMSFAVSPPISSGKKEASPLIATRPVPDHAGEDDARLPSFRDFLLMCNVPMSFSR